MLKRPAIPILTAAILLAAGCGAVRLSSRWVGGEPSASIDSLLTLSLTPLEGKPAMVGLLNDSSYLYLALSTNDRSLERQIMMRGLTVWFDHEGGQDKRFGIRFPAGIDPLMFAGARDRFDRRPGEGDAPEARDSIPEWFHPDTTEAEITGPFPGDFHKVNVVTLRDIRIHLEQINGSVKYTLRVPLTDRGRDPYAIGAMPGTVVGIGLESGVRPQRQEEGEPGGGGRGGFGGGGRRGGGRGRMEGGGPPGGFNRQSEPLDVWGQVRLETASSSAKTATQ